MCIVLLFESKRTNCLAHRFGAAGGTFSRVREKYNQYYLPNSLSPKPSSIIWQHRCGIPIKLYCHISLYNLRLLSSSHFVQHFSRPFLLPSLRTAVLHGRFNGVAGHFGPHFRAHPGLAQHVGVGVAKNMLVTRRRPPPSGAALKSQGFEVDFHTMRRDFIAPAVDHPHLAVGVALSLSKPLPRTEMDVEFIETQGFIPPTAPRTRPPKPRIRRRDKPTQPDGLL